MCVQCTQLFFSPVSNINSLKVLLKHNLPLRTAALFRKPWVRTLPSGNSHKWGIGSRLHLGGRNVAEITGPTDELNWLVVLLSMFDMFMYSFRPFNWDNFDRFDHLFVSNARLDRDTVWWDPFLELNWDLVSWNTKRSSPKTLKNHEIRSKWQKPLVVWGFAHANFTGESASSPQWRCGGDLDAAAKFGLGHFHLRSADGHVPSRSRGQHFRVGFLGYSIHRKGHILGMLLTHLEPLESTGKTLFSQRHTVFACTNGRRNITSSCTSKLVFATGEICPLEKPINWFAKERFALGNPSEFNPLLAQSVWEKEMFEWWAPVWISPQMGMFWQVYGFCWLGQNVQVTNSSEVSLTKVDSGEGPNFRGSSRATRGYDLSTGLFMTLLARCCRRHSADVGIFIHLLHWK